MVKQLYPYLKLTRIHKPIGILLLLWPTLWALWIAANGIPNLYVLMIFVLGVVIMRSAGCVINDIADRKLDGQVQRTKTRPLITGEVKLKEALVIFFLLCSVALLLVLQLNTYSIYLSLVALALATVYPFCKRLTYFPQVVLGAAFGWSIPMAFAAQTKTVPLQAWLIFGIAVLWSVAYDSVYALMDRNDDIKAGIKSTVIYFGSYATTIIFLMQSIVILGLCLLGNLLQLSFYFYAGVTCALILMCYQFYLVRVGAYLKAFQNNNWVGLIIFLGIVFSYWQ